MIRIGSGGGLYYTIIIQRNHQNPIQTIQAPTLHLKPASDETSTTSLVEGLDLLSDLVARIR